MTDTINNHEALIFAMVTMSAVDRKMDDSELGRIGDIVKQLPAFADYNPDDLIDTAKKCGAILSDDGGLERVLAAIHDTLPGRMYETAYALAVEIAAADLEISREELRFLELLADRLGLDSLTTAAIERGARARHLSA